MKLRPPQHTSDRTYNGAPVPEDGVEVLDQDVEALLAAGWVPVGPVLDNQEG